MRHLKILVLLVFALSARLNEGYRILCLFPFNGRSHFMMFDALCKGLARRGHRIEMISHFPTKEPIPNYMDLVDLSGTMKSVDNVIDIDYGKSISSVTYSVASKFGSDICELMGHEKMQKFIKNQSKRRVYDLVITEYLGSPCYLGFGKILKAPVAIVTTFFQIPNIDNFMANPSSYAFYSSGLNEKVVLTTFFDRVWNTLLSYKQMYEFNYYTSDQTMIMRKYLGQNLPNIRQLERSVALALVNGHYTISGIRPTVPAIVEVGGLHVDRNESTLTQELESWLNSANQGLVYFTFGTLMNVETLPRNMILDLYASFAKISPVKVLMKSANATTLPPGIPSNVVTLPWIPQIPVLKHKNTRVFITHGGLMGVQEAIYYGIPMIGIPVFGDQMKNVNILVHKNMGVLMNLDDITEHSMDSALNALLHNPKYKESARKSSELFRDRPLSAMNTAAYWIEYVIRNGADSLRPPSMDIPWWKINLIDIFASIIICITVLVYLFVIVVKILIRKIYQNNVQIKEKSN